MRRPAPGRTAWIWGLLFLAAVLGACATQAASPRSACTLTQPADSTMGHDVPSGVTPFGDGIVATGARFTGSSGTGFSAFAGPDQGWTTMLVEAYGNRIVELDDVSATGHEAWAVGALTDVAPVAARWDGHTWVATTVVDPGPGEDGFAGVAAVSPNLVWAVGRHQDGIPFRTLIERWDGSAWHTVPSPNVGSTSNMLKAVAASGSGDAWAVGWSVQGGRYRTLAQHWNGTAWTIVPTPNGGAGDSLLSGVAVAGRDDVWAVGWTAREDDRTPLVLHWDGRAWNHVELPANAAHAALADVATTGGAVVAVGRLYGGPQPQPLVMRKDGESWDLTPFDVGPDPGWLTGAAIDRTGALWTVGTLMQGNNSAASLVLTGCDAG
jgi:hypothetical protein